MTKKEILRKIETTNELIEADIIHAVSNAHIYIPVPVSFAGQIRETLKEAHNYIKVGDRVDSKSTMSELSEQDDHLS